MPAGSAGDRSIGDRAATGQVPGGSDRPQGIQDAATKQYERDEGQWQIAKIDTGDMAIVAGDIGGKGCGCEHSKSTDHFSWLQTLIVDTHKIVRSALKVTEL